ncbi:MAG: hypothetical protein Q8P84_04455 [Deltaproteobacteria bacterium]|nr:hypothetical protein [Deltaproteobacteria bacterium]
MGLDPISPQDIQRVQNQPQTSFKPKAMEFGDIMGATSAMTPFATEFTKQSTGSVNAATVLNAAFSSFPNAAAAFAGGAPSWSSAGYSAAPYGAMTPGYGATGGIPGLANTYGSPGQLPVSGGQAVPGTNMSQAQLMEVMNQNNLQLIELQAIMQSNMQTWNTKSNILSADHRAKMSMIEKFTARG